MNKAIHANCAACPLSNPIHTVVPSYGPKDPQLIVVGEGPGPVEAAFGRPFAGASGDLLQKLLEGAGIDWSRVFLTNATLCYPRMGDKDEVLSEAVGACAGRLEYALRQVEPAPILALGKWAQTALGVGREDQWTREKLGGRWALGSIHPAKALREPEKLVFLERAIAKVAAGPVVKAAPPHNLLLVDRPTLLPPPHRFGLMEHIAVDIETNTRDWTAPDARVILLGIGNCEDVYVLTEDVLNSTRGQQWFVDMWAMYSNKIGGHNYKFDALFNHRMFGLMMNHGFDTMLMVNQIHEHWYKDLKSLATYYFDADDYGERLVYSWLRENVKVEAKRTFDQVPIGRLVEYLGLDIYYTSLLEKELRAELIQAGRYFEPYARFELPLSNAMAEVEAYGFAVDTDRLTKAQAAMEGDVLMLASAVTKLSEGQITNPNSVPQIAHYLYDVLKLKHSVKGYAQRSTAKPVLKSLSETNRIVEAVVAYRRVAKLKNSFLDNLWQLIRWDPHTRSYRVHPSYKLAHVITGRLSAVHPAIQTIPRKNDKDDSLPAWLSEYLQQLGYTLPTGGYGERVKSVYVAAPGYILVLVDGSQWELRVIAAWSQDPYLLQAYLNDEDFHSFMCDLLFGPGQWEEAERANEKRLMFAMAYGGTLESALSISEFTTEQKEMVRDVFYNKLTRFVTWRQDMFDLAKTQGYVVSPYFNRMFHFDLHTNGNQRDIEKFSVNYPTQGTASSITMDAMVEALPRIRALGGGIVAAIHDAIIGEVPLGREYNAIHILSQELSAAGHRFNSSIPWRTDAKVGLSWGEMVKATEELSV